MELVNAVNTKKRMCERYKSYCKDCPMSSYNNGVDMCCADLLEEEPTIADKILSEWAVAHPPMTNKDKFLEVFGKDITEDIFCGQHDNCKGFSCKDRRCDECPGYEFWDKEYKEISNGK